MMPTEEEREVKAQMLYATYALAKVTQGGLALPEWPSLSDHDRNAWRSVADAVPVRMPAFARNKKAKDE